VVGPVVIGGTYAAIALTLVYTLRTGISPVPTSPRVRRALLGALPAALGPGTIFELGCGWGSLALPLARAYPGHRVEAYELSPIPWAVCRVRALLGPGGGNLGVHRRCMHRADLRGASLVVCYLYPGGMESLRPKFEAELPPGALVTSNFFPVPGWEPARTVRVDDLEGSRVYLYRVGEL